jgi:hypothetical protein
MGNCPSSAAVSHSLWACFYLHVGERHLQEQCMLVLPEKAEVCFWLCSTALSEDELLQRYSLYPRTLAEQSESDCRTKVNARLAKKAEERQWHGAVPLLVGAVALALMPAFMGRVTWAAFAFLSLAAAGIWAVHGPLLSWPAAILQGTNAAAGLIPIWAEFLF